MKKTDKTKITGPLLNASQEEIILKTANKEEVPGKKGKKLVERETSIPFTEIDQTKIEISFK